MKPTILVLTSGESISIALSDRDIDVAENACLNGSVFSADDGEGTRATVSAGHLSAVIVLPEGVDRPGVTL